MLGAMQIMEPPLKGLQRGTKLTTGLETILRGFWQRMWLLPALKAKLKSNNFLGRGGFKTTYLTVTWLLVITLSSEMKKNRS